MREAHSKKKETGSKKKRPSGSAFRIPFTLKEYLGLPVSRISTNGLKKLPVIERHDRIVNVLHILTDHTNVWVVDSMDTMELVGIITEHDILNLMVPSKGIPLFGMASRSAISIDIGESLEYVMQSKPNTCYGSDTIAHVLNRMNKYQRRRLAMVKKNNTLTGEITLHQIIRGYYVCAVNALEREHGVGQ